jgi:hypothetical protein
VGLASQEKGTRGDAARANGLAEPRCETWARPENAHGYRRRHVALAELSAHAATMTLTPHQAAERWNARIAKIRASLSARCLPVEIGDMTKLVDTIDRTMWELLAIEVTKEQRLAYYAARIRIATKRPQPGGPETPCTFELLRGWNARLDKVDCSEPLQIGAVSDEWVGAIADALEDLLGTAAGSTRPN